MSFSDSFPDGPFELRRLSPAMERLFDPYNRLLRRLVHPDLSWTRRDHEKRLPDLEGYLKGLLTMVQMQKRRDEGMSRNRAESSEKRARGVHFAQG